MLSSWNKNPRVVDVQMYEQTNFHVFQNRACQEEHESGFRATGNYPLNRIKFWGLFPKFVLGECLGLMTKHVGKVFSEEFNKKKEEITKRLVTSMPGSLNLKAEAKS